MGGSRQAVTESPAHCVHLLPHHHTTDRWRPENGFVRRWRATPDRLGSWCQARPEWTSWRSRRFARRMLEELDRRIAAIRGLGNLSWEQTESILGASARPGRAMRQGEGQRLPTSRATRGAALSIDDGVPTGPNSQRPDFEDSIGEDGYRGHKYERHRSKPLDESGHEVGDGKLAFPSLTSSASARPCRIDPSTRRNAIGEDPAHPATRLCPFARHDVGM